MNHGPREAIATQTRRLPSFRATAAPIPLAPQLRWQPYRPRGEVVAAMSISVPAARMGARRQGELAAVVMDAAAQLSRRLGGPSHVPVAL